MFYVVSFLLSLCSSLSLKLTNWPSVDYKSWVRTKVTDWSPLSSECFMKWFCLDSVGLYGSLGLSAVSVFAHRLTIFMFSSELIMEACFCRLWRTGVRRRGRTVTWEVRITLSETLTKRYLTTLGCWSWPRSRGTEPSRWGRMLGWVTLLGACRWVVDWVNPHQS